MQPDDREWISLEDEPIQRVKLMCYSQSMGIVIGYYIAGLYWDESIRYVIPSVMGWLPLPNKIPLF